MARHSRKHNRQFYTFGATKVPSVTQDRYYSADWVRDMRYNEGLAARALLDLLGVSSTLVSGGLVSQGASVTQLNITAAVGYCEFDVEVPADDSAWAVPPPYETRQIAVTARLPALTNFDLTSTSMNFDGATSNYLKLKYVENNVKTRTRKYGAATYAYSVEDSYSLVCDTVAVTAKDVLLATLVGNGTSTLTITQNTATAKVPKAASADTAATATSATSADSATTAASADTATVVPIHGYYEASMSSLSTIYDFIKNFIPNTEDTAIITGAIRTGTVTLVCSRMERMSTTEIRIHGISLATNSYAYITVGTSTFDSANYSLSW